MKTALIVDPDLAFGFWLARGLDQTAYQAYPTKSIPDAKALIAELRLQINLLFLNPTLAESTEFIEMLRQANDHVKVVALIGDQPHLPAIAARVDLCCRKPDTSSDVKRREWIEHVEELLPASLFGAALESSALLRKCAGALVHHGPRKEAAPPAWKEWEGRVIDRQFRLDRHLGGGGQSAVFLTRYGNEPQHAAAIKVVLADSVDRKVLLPRWERAAGLSHPGLVRLFGMGDCECQGTGVLYLVMEYADENLADVLQQRALTPGETREMLEPVLDALGYVHSRGLVHGRVKPSNILAIDDRLKISSDWLHPAGEPNPGPAQPGVYDPPEGQAGFISPAGDVWSVGVTLVEALTQRPLLAKRPQNKPPALPVALPPLFLDIAHQCLQPDPKRRETVAHLVHRLREAPASLEEPAPPPRRWFRGWRYAIPIVALGIGLSAVLVRPPLRNMAPAPVHIPVPAPVPPAPPATPVAATPPPAPAAAPAPRSVVDQPLPEVSQKARKTIEGTLEVRVHVTVDPSGSVVDAKLDTPGPSRYFANRALDAARRWKFDPIAGEAPATQDEWMLRFDYTKDDTEATSEHLTQ